MVMIYGLRRVEAVSQRGDGNPTPGEGSDEEGAFEHAAHDEGVNGHDHGKPKQDPAVPFNGHDCKLHNKLTLFTIF